MPPDLVIPFAPTISLVATYINATETFLAWPFRHSGHMQLVYDDGDPTTPLVETEVNAPSDLVFGDWVFEPFGQLHGANTDHISDMDVVLNPDRYGITTLILQPYQSADEVWQVLGNVRDAMIEAAFGIDYSASQNSNSYVRTMLYSVGIELDDYLPAATPVDIDRFPGSDRNVLLGVTQGGDGNIAIDMVLTGARGGSAGADFIRTGTGDDSIEGGKGDDRLEGGKGDDTLDGGAGIDTARFDGPQSAFTLTLSPDLVTLLDRREGGLGLDHLRAIEFLDFASEIDLFAQTPMNLQLFDGPTGLSASEFSQIIELYIAYFDRAPDAIGLSYWATEFSKGFTLSRMAESFFEQAETRATYAGLLDESFQLDLNDGAKVSAFVSAVYDNVLGRAPDDMGFAYWTGELSSNPAITPANFILSVIGGAKFPSLPTALTAIDQAYLATKSDLGAYFAVIKGMSDLEDAQDALAFFTGSAQSLSEAIAAIDGHYADALDPFSGDFLMPLVGVIDDPFGL